MPTIESNTFSLLKKLERSSAIRLEEWEKWFNVTTSPKLAISWNTAALSSPGMAFSRTLAAMQLRSNSSTVLMMYEFTSLSMNSSFLNSILRRWPKAQSGSARPKRHRTYHLIKDINFRGFIKTFSRGQLTKPGVQNHPRNQSICCIPSF